MSGYFLFMNPIFNIYPLCSLQKDHKLSSYYVKHILTSTQNKKVRSKYLRSYLYSLYLSITTVH